MNRLIICCLRNLYPSNCNLRSFFQSFLSANVGSARIRRATVISWPFKSRERSSLLIVIYYYKVQHTPFPLKGEGLGKGFGSIASSPLLTHRFLAKTIGVGWLNSDYTFPHICLCEPAKRAWQSPNLITINNIATNFFAHGSGMGYSALRSLPPTRACSKR